ncbi:hypothetical protein EI94DRAFT_1913316 [Lactarius quietus]|nr:hypothetical protein EI94DRAFT_1913316 [Lactarius quietus]
MTSGTPDSGHGDDSVVETSLEVREEPCGDGLGGIKMPSSLPIGTGGSYTGARGAPLSLNVKSGTNMSPPMGGGDRITGKWDDVGVPYVGGALPLVLEADPIDSDHHGAGIWRYWWDASRWTRIKLWDWQTSWEGAPQEGQLVRKFVVTTTIEPAGVGIVRNQGLVLEQQREVIILPETQEQCHRRCQKPRYHTCWSDPCVHDQVLAILEVVNPDFAPACQVGEEEGRVGQEQHAYHS